MLNYQTNHQSRTRGFCFRKYLCRYMMRVGGQGGKGQARGGGRDRHRGEGAGTGGKGQAQGGGGEESNLVTYV